MIETDKSLLSPSQSEFRQINWSLMLIPVAGLLFFVAMFWAEIAIRPSKQAATATGQAIAAVP
ncbi:MAG: hypothetical protein WCK05_07235, partial [Planctomycetota bacterium]